MNQSKDKDFLIILYEINHIDQVLKYLIDKNISISSCIVIALEFEIGRILKERGIVHETLQKYISVNYDFSDNMLWAHEVSYSFAQHPSMRFFTYKGISLGDVFEPMIDTYLQHVGRYTYIFDKILNRFSGKKLIIPYTTKSPSSTSSVLVPFEISSVVDVARLICKRFNLEIDVIGDAIRVNKKESITTRIMTISFFAVYNLFMKLNRRSYPVKIFASEYWSQISTLVEKMDNLELILMERNEIKNIPLKQLFKHRIRFIHPSSFINTGIRKKVNACIRNFDISWNKVRQEVSPIFNKGPYGDIWTIIEPAFDCLITEYSSRAMFDIDGLRLIMKNEKPNKIILRASIGIAQHHFLIAARVASQMNIPSIELQHGIAFIDPKFILSRLETSHIAVYGSLTRNILIRNHMYIPERIYTIGSPRFDKYILKHDLSTRDRVTRLLALGLNPKHPVIFVTIPVVSTNPPHPFIASTFQFADFFFIFRKVQKKIPEIQFIFKFRPGDFSIKYQDYVKEIFTDGGVYLTNDTDLFSLITLSDIAVSGLSSVMYEIMLSKKPLILFFPWKTATSYQVKLYVDLYKKAVPTIFNAEDLIKCVSMLMNKKTAENVVYEQNEFLSKNYSFDGKSSIRLKNIVQGHLQIPT